MSPIAEEKAHEIARASKIILDPAQEEYAVELVKTFDTLFQDVYGGDASAVRRLFSIDDTDTFNVADTTKALNKAIEEAQQASQTAKPPQPLGLEFTKAGFPLSKQATLSAATNGRTKWDITDRSLDQITGTIQAISNNEVTFKIGRTVAPKDADLAGATFTITTGTGKGLTGKIVSYVASTKVATMEAGWGDAPAAGTSKASISGTDLTGLDIVDDGNGNVQVTIPNPSPAYQQAGALKGATVTITDAPGTGLTGIVQKYDYDQANTQGIAVTGLSIAAPANYDDSTFAVTKFWTKYTLTDTEDSFLVYADSNDPAQLIEYRIAQLDALISRQLSEIMHQPDFRQLEASWRGLHHLVFNSETGTRLKLRLLNATRKALQNDLDNAVEFDQSVLFKKIYEAEYGMFGGSPYSALLGDFEFGRHPQDVNLLEKLSNVAAAAHAPFIAAAAPELFDMERFTDLDKPRDLATLFESAELIKWRAFRASEDSRYATLVLPHVMMRLPYGPDTNPVDEFNFVETAAADDDFLWGNAAWFLAQRMTNAFSLYSWTGAIRGYEGGGLVAGLPIYTFKTDHGDVAVRVPTEIALTDRREKELSDLGFIALCYRKETDQAAFFGGQTTNKPKVYLEDNATANARLSASLPYMLAASRFAHYIKVIMRDRIGSFMSQAEVSTLLNRWIAQYVLLNDEAGQETKARYPLREARIDVTADPAKPGVYKAIVFIRPHFQLEELTVSIRLVAELPPPAGG